MTPSDALQQKMASLPEPVLDYLYSERAGELNEKIISRNKLREDQEPLLFTLLREVVVRAVTINGIEEEVKKRFSLDDVKAKQLAADIAGYRLLPLDRWLGDVSGYIRHLGADVASYPAERVQLVERSRSEAASEVVDAASEAMATTQRVRERMKDVVTSFLAGIRTEPQALEVLSRPDKIGGVGLDAETAKKIIEEAKQEARSVIIKEEPVGGVSTAAASVDEAAAQASPSVPVPAPSKPKDDFSTIKPEDEEEIELLKEDAAAKGAQKSDETAKNIDASIETIYLASGLVTEDEALAKRVKTVIGNRLRDVRDQMETLETMVQPKELGGLGLSQDAARALLSAIQASLHEVHESHAAEIRDQKEKWVEEGRQKEAEAPAKEAAAEGSELERLYQSIVAKSKKATKMAAQAAPAPLPIAAPPAAQAAPVAPPNLPISDANPVPPYLRAPAVVPLPETPAVRPVPTPTSVLPQPPLTLVRPVPGAPVVPPTTMRGPGEINRPRMEDVKSSPRLTGPVEELRAISIVDFRRLSKDPKEAALKVKDKIDLLAEQSYTRRTEGIAAWSASEVVRTYLELMREGLNGTPLKDAVAARLEAKKPYLTPEEFQAVSELSRQLRY